MVRLSEDTKYDANIEAERLLNGAIIGADIPTDCEEKHDALDGFYADDIKATRQRYKGAALGKAAVWSRVTALITPLFALTDIDNISISIRTESIRTEARDETHTLWTLEVGWETGRRCVLQWRSFRRWREGRVVYERHHEVERTGGLLPTDELYMLPHGRSGQEIIH